eukprot:IDg14878t1
MSWYRSAVPLSGMCTLARPSAGPRATAVDGDALTLLRSYRQALASHTTELYRCFGKHKQNQLRRSNSQAPDDDWQYQSKILKLKLRMNKEKKTTTQQGHHTFHPSRQQRIGRSALWWAPSACTTARALLSPNKHLPMEQSYRRLQGQALRVSRITHWPQTIAHRKGRIKGDYSCAERRSTIIHTLVRKTSFCMTGNKRDDKFHAFDALILYELNGAYNFQEIKTAAVKAYSTHAERDDYRPVCEKVIYSNAHADSQAANQGASKGSFPSHIRKGDEHYTPALNRKLVPASCRHTSADAALPFVSRTAAQQLARKSPK